MVASVMLLLPTAATVSRSANASSVPTYVEEASYSKEVIGSDIIQEPDMIAPEEDILLSDIEKEDGTFGWCQDTYEKQQEYQESLASADVMAFSGGILAESPHGELRVMHAATQTENRIVIKIIADRYMASQQEAFFTVAQNMANYFVNEHPLDEFREWIQIYAIGTISPTATQSVIVGDGSAGTASGQIVANNVRPFVQHHFPGANPSIANNISWLVVQQGRGGGYAWTGSGVAVTSVSLGVALHELGHLWQLWDEYDSATWHYASYRNGANLRSNVNLSSPLTGVLSASTATNTAIPSQWGLFIGETAGPNNQWQGIAGMGIYRMNTFGWGTTTWYRPRQRCLMNQANTNDGFCLVCSEHLARRFAPNRIDNTIVRSYVFAGSTQETVEIGASVTSIGDYAFLRNTNLHTIDVYAPVPPTFRTDINNTFAGIANLGNISLNVPLGSEELFINSPWGVFNINSVHFSISGTPLEQDDTYTFASVAFGYSQITPRNVIISNVGAGPVGQLTIVLSGEDADAFALGATLIEGVAAGGIASFGISPVVGLDAGAYEAVITISGAHGVSFSFQVEFVVNRANPPSHGVPAVIYIENILRNLGDYADTIMLRDIELRDGWAWDEEDLDSVLALGSHTFTARFVGDNNINDGNVTVTFTLREMPELTPRVITLGDVLVISLIVVVVFGVAVLFVRWSMKGQNPEPREKQSKRAKNK